MKVLYIASSPVMSGGATKSLILMLTQMRKHGINVEVVCPEDKGLTKWLRDNGFKVYVAYFKAVCLPSLKTASDIIKWIPRFIYYSWTNYRGISQVKRIAAESAPDIIHENTSTINVGFHAAKHIGVPYVMHIREFGSLESNMKVPGRKRRLKDRNVYSIPITRVLSRFLSLDSNPRSVQIYDGIVKESDFRMNEKKEKWLLYAGRIESAKGISDLLEAYADYVKKSRSPYPLWVCGGGVTNYIKEMKAFAADNGIANNVIWLGERDDLDDLMARTAVTVMPSRCEGLGRVMPEAMTNGSICVVRNISGTKEQLENGQNLTGAPIAFAYENNEQLTDILIELTETIEAGNAFSPEREYRKMIERSQAAVKEYFTEERFGEKLIGFYDMIIRQNRKES